MWSRALFASVVIFFVVMNILLFRSEFGGQNEVRSAIPAELVFQKILTSPDNSFLEIRHHGKKVGTCQWSPAVGQESTIGRLMTDEVPPEGMVEELTSYTIDANGNVTLDELTRLRFGFDLRLSTNLVWEKFNLHVALRPATLQVSSTASEKTLQVRMDDGATKTERSFTFEDLLHPDRILHSLGGPLLPSLAGAIGLPFNSSTNLSVLNPKPGGSSRLSLKWDAREDKLKVGGTFMRVYRLQTRVLDSFPIIVFVSRVGEILRIELPDEIVLANDVLLNL
ncbi:MAG: hypothetical protein JWM16_3283 [Verrucomicrobiales bacterium]|nr:hypothetical protein [Verrucomicrobiales bacterium]